jgi:hypothetical protein
VVNSSSSRYSNHSDYSRANQATYSELGRDWAKDLRQDIATFDQFEKYLRENITKISTENYNNFRNGFITAYGVNGEAAFDKYFQQARGNI